MEEAAALSPVALLGGDAGSDEDTVAGDLARIAEFFNAPDGIADINGIVDVYDLALAVMNFGKGEKR